MSGKRPLVSVVIVTYNQAHWVADAVRSAIAQDYANLEVIVADDASTDGTQAIIEELAAQTRSKRVIAVLGDRNLGMTGNLNRGLRAASGEYVAISAGDDMLLPGKISAQVAWFEADPRRVLCGHDAKLIDERGAEVGLYSALCRLREGTGAEAVIAAGPPFAATSAMVRSDVIPAQGFDERVKLSSDWKMWVGCLARGGRYGYVPGVYSAYRMHADSLSGRARVDPGHEHEMFEDVLRALAIIEEEHPEFHRAVRRQRSKQYAHRAWRALGYGNPAASRRFARRAASESVRMGRLGWLSLVIAHAPDSVARAFRSDGRLFGRLDPAATTWLSRRLRRLAYLVRVQAGTRLHR